MLNRTPSPAQILLSPKLMAQAIDSMHRQMLLNQWAAQEAAAERARSRYVYTPTGDGVAYTWPAEIRRHPYNQCQMKPAMKRGLDAKGNVVWSPVKALRESRVDMSRYDGEDLRNLRADTGVGHRPRNKLGTERCACELIKHNDQYGNQVNGYVRFDIVDGVMVNFSFHRRGGKRMRKLEASFSEADWTLLIMMVGRDMKAKLAPL